MTCINILKINIFRNSPMPSSWPNALPSVWPTPCPQVSMSMRLKFTRWFWATSMTRNISGLSCPLVCFPSSRSVHLSSSFNCWKSTKTFSSMTTVASKWPFRLWTLYWQAWTKTMKNSPNVSSPCAKRSANATGTFGWMGQCGSTS